MWRSAAALRRLGPAGRSILGSFFTSRNLWISTALVSTGYCLSIDSPLSYVPHGFCRFYEGLSRAVPGLRARRLAVFYHVSRVSERWRLESPALNAFLLDRICKEAIMNHRCLLPVVADTVPLPVKKLSLPESPFHSESIVSADTESAAAVSPELLKTRSWFRRRPQRDKAGDAIRTVDNSFEAVDSRKSESKSTTVSGSVTTPVAESTSSAIPTAESTHSNRSVEQPDQVSSKVDAASATSSSSAVNTNDEMLFPNTSTSDPPKPTLVANETARNSPEDSDPKDESALFVVPPPPRGVIWMDRFREFIEREKKKLAEIVSPSFVLASIHDILLPQVKTAPSISAVLDRVHHLTLALEPHCSNVERLRAVHLTVSNFMYRLVCRGSIENRLFTDGPSLEKDRLLLQFFHLALVTSHRMEYLSAYEDTVRLPPPPPKLPLTSTLDSSVDLFFVGRTREALQEGIRGLSSSFAPSSARSEVSSTPLSTAPTLVPPESLLWCPREAVTEGRWKVTKIWNTISRSAKFRESAKRIVWSGDFARSKAIASDGSRSGNVAAEAQLALLTRNVAELRESCRLLVAEFNKSDITSRDAEIRQALNRAIQTPRAWHPFDSKYDHSLVARIASYIFSGPVVGFAVGTLLSHYLLFYHPHYLTDLSRYISQQVGYKSRKSSSEANLPAQVPYFDSATAATGPLYAEPFPGADDGLFFNTMGLEGTDFYANNVGFYQQQVPPNYVPM